MKCNFIVLKYGTFIAITFCQLPSAALMVLMILGSSCQQGANFECIKRTGKIITETRNISDFSVIEIYNNMPVYLIQDSINLIEIKGGENLLPEVESTIEKKKLILRNNNRCNFARTYSNQIDIVIHFKNLNELIYRGTAAVTSVNTITTDTFTFNCYDGMDSIKLNLDVPLMYANIHTGVADLIVSGKATQLYAYARSSGTFRMQQFKCKRVYTNNISSSDHFFYAEEKLEALVQYVGNTYCYGNPSNIIKTENNTGRLILRN